MPRRPPPVDVPQGQESPLAYAVHSRDVNILDTVEAALRHREVYLAYQPVMEARRAGHIAFYEGLLRVLDPTGRVIPALDFIHAAEDLELGRRLDCTALELGLQTLLDAPQVKLSLNMSARSIGYGEWLRVLRTGLAQDPSIGERLILEISEASAMRVPELVMGFMRQMRRHGIGFALDEFGAGMTSLRHLRDFRFDLAKFDQQYCVQMRNTPSNQLLVQVMAQVSRKFSMMTVATGVEDKSTATWLRTLGVDYLQGYHFAAPTMQPPWLSEARKGVG